MKRKLAFLLLCVSVLTFTFFIGQILAYWVSEDKTDNLITTGQLTTKIVEDYEQNQIVYPGDVVSKTVNVANTGNVSSIIRVKVKKAWGQVRENGILLIDSTLSTDNIEISYNTTSWFFDITDGYYYYKDVLEPGETTTEPLFSEFRITSSTDNTFANMHADIKIEMESVQAMHDAVSIWGKTHDSLGITYDSEEIIPNQVPIVSFVNPLKKFTFVSGNNDVFCSWEQLVPGESRSQIISLQNLYTQEVPISIKAVYSDVTDTNYDKDLTDDLLKKYVTINITDSSGNIVYNGPIFGNLDDSITDTNDSMKNYISLGKFASNEKKNYNITVAVSPEMDNRYSNLTGRITWVFQAAGSSESDYPDSPDTGDSTNMLICVPGILLSGFLIFFLTIQRRRINR